MSEVNVILSKNDPKGDGFDGTSWAYEMLGTTCLNSFEVKSNLIDIELLKKLLTNTNIPRYGYCSLQNRELHKLYNEKDANLIIDCAWLCIENSPDFINESKQDSKDNKERIVLVLPDLSSLMYEIKLSKGKVHTDIEILYPVGTDISKVLEYFKTILSPMPVPRDDSNYICLVTENNGTLTTSDFTIKKPKINIPLAYGEEFAAYDKQIYKTLCNNDKGIWIFHGDPGTGKSIWLRHLIGKLNKTNKVQDVIYMPSEMVKMIETPSFIPFIQQYQDSVLIIEDADIALQSRKQYGSIVNTLLNLTDGILADCLRLKIVATFNCELDKIDSALLRKGRLVFRHEFKPIPRSQAIKLAEWLKIDITVFNSDSYKNKDEWTLAEVYNIHENFHWEKSNKKLGFGK